MITLTRLKLSELLIRAFKWIGVDEKKKVVFAFHSDNPVELDKWLSDFTQFNCMGYVNILPQAEYDHNPTHSNMSKIICYLSMDREPGRWIEDPDNDQGIGSLVGTGSIVGMVEGSDDDVLIRPLSDVNYVI